MTTPEWVAAFMAEIEACWYEEGIQYRLPPGQESTDAYNGCLGGPAAVEAILSKHLEAYDLQILGSKA